MLSEKSFSYENSKYELTGDQKQYYDYCKSQYIKDGDSLILSKFTSSLVSELQSKKTWNKQDLISKACNVLINEASEANVEKKILGKELDLLLSHRIIPYEKKI